MTRCDIINIYCQIFFWWFSATFLILNGHIIAPMNKKIKYINRIRVVRNIAENDLLFVKACGTTEIMLQAVPVLVPKKYDSVPEDGIYELDFKLDENQNDITGVILEVEVVLRLSELPEWVKGIRVNANENSDIELI